ncbi:MAG: HAMP domain-containing histidine kinase [Opitutaceae bacterium]|nr:HAMP domain-containing histidine kinase [Opitutaceae bacterium]
MSSVLESTLQERARQAMALTRSDPATARRLAGEVLAGAEDPGTRAAALLVQTTLLHRDSQHADARNLAREALQLARTAGNQDLVTRSLNMLGLIQHALADERSALEYFHESARSAEAAGDGRGVTAALANTAMVMHAQGDRESALQVFRDILSRPHVRENPQFLAQTRHNLAQTLWDLGRDLPECAELFAQAAAGKKALGDRWSLAFTLCSLSGVQRDLGRFAAARETLREVESLLTGEASQELRYLHHLNLGVLLLAPNHPGRDPAAALVELDAALRAAQATKTPSYEALSRQYMAEALMVAGRPAEACEQLKAAAKIREEFQRDESRRHLERLRVAFEAERAQTEAAHERKLRTEAEAFNAQIREQNARLEKLYREKSDIIGLIAHDLRAPLAAALELVNEIAADPADRQNVAETAALLAAGHRQMLDLTQSLLDIEAIESGTMRTKEGSADLAALFADLQLAHAADIRTKSLHIGISLPAGRLTWWGPVLLLQRVAENLFSNAVKYTPHGGRIMLAAGQEADGLRLRVSDNGPGIPPDQRDRLFEKFATAGSLPTGGEAVHGLGLYLAQCCARHAGGSIRYEDTPGGGATFVLELPAAS